MMRWLATIELVVDDLDDPELVAKYLHGILITRLGAYTNDRVYPAGEKPVRLRPLCGRDAAKDPACIGVCTCRQTEREGLRAAAQQPV